MGWKPCSGNRKQCPVCPLTFPATSEIVNDFNSYKHVIKENVNCQSKNVIYLWRCKKQNCKDYSRNSYVGKTTQTFQKRFSQHRDYVKQGILTEPSGLHFNLPGHSVSDMEGLVIEHFNE